MSTTVATQEGIPLTFYFTPALFFSFVQSHKSYNYIINSNFITIVAPIDFKPAFIKPMSITNNQGIHHFLWFVIYIFFTTSFLLYYKELPSQVKLHLLHQPYNMKSLTSSVATLLASSLQCKFPNMIYLKSPLALFILDLEDSTEHIWLDTLTI